MQKIQLTATKKLVHYLYFYSRNTNEFETSRFRVPKKLNSKQLLVVVKKMIVKHINKRRLDLRASETTPQTFLIKEFEIITDNRNDFGHKKIQTEREVKIIIPETHLGGTIYSLGNALKKYTPESYPSEANWLKNLVVFHEKIAPSIDQIPANFLKIKIIKKFFWKHTRNEQGIEYTFEKFDAGPILRIRESTVVKAFL